MKQRAFENKHRAFWQTLEEALSAKTSPNFDFPTAYRQLCHHLALAKQRNYSPVLVAQLSSLAKQGHQQLYRRRGGGWAKMSDYFLYGFPRALRRERRFFLVSCLLFFGTLIGMTAWVLAQPEIVYTILDGGEISQIEAMYDPSNDVLGRERGDDSDVLMFGFYIRNNASIGLQTFGGGLLAGLGTIFYLVFNGIFLGAVSGHLIGIGFGTQTFLPFVAGHSAMELTAIAVSGAAGLILAHSLWFPNRLRRLDALKAAAKRSMDLVGGLVTMFVLAAAIEAFFSASTSIPVWFKYAFGIGQWLLVIAYFVFAGRQHES